MENQNNNVVRDGMVSGTFVGRSIDHDLEYIGAPGGTEDSAATVNYVGCGYRYGLENGMLKYYDQHGKFDGQAAIQSGERMIDVMEALFHQPYNHLESNYERFILNDGCSVYSKPDSVNKDFTGGQLNTLYYDDRLYGDIEDKIEEQMKTEMENYFIKTHDAMMGKFGLGADQSGLYSKLSNVNINNGLDSTFSFNSCNKPAQIAEKVVENKTYKPLPDCLTIRESSIDGLGIFAQKHIDKDVTLGITHHYIDVGFKSELIRTPLAGFLNHSFEPNAVIEEYENGKGRDHTYENYKLITTKSIIPGEEITVNYNDCLWGLTGYDGAEFLKEEDKIENRIYKSAYGDMYKYNPSFGKFKLVGVSRNNGRIFYSAEGAEIFLNRIN